MATQLPLPFAPPSRLTRDSFIVAPANTQAIAFIDAWPDWPVPAAALFGPASAGKSHLVEIWLAKSGGARIPAAELAAIPPEALPRAIPLAIEDMDRSQASPARDRALFTLFEQAVPGAPLLLTGRAKPGEWAVTLPDLASRFAAMLAFPLWAPDDGQMAELARKLFADRQLQVPDAVIERMLRSLERSPAAIRNFVIRLDAMALAGRRDVTLGLVRELLTETDGTPGD